MVILKEGPLQKRKVSKRIMGGRWGKKYFQLTSEAILEYANKPEVLKLSGIVNSAEEKAKTWPLLSIGVVANVDIESQSSAMFKIFFKNGVEMVLKAENSSEANEWIKDIKNNVTKLRKHLREISVRQSVSRIVSDNAFTPEMIGCENIDLGLFEQSLTSVQEKNQLPDLDLYDEHSLNRILSPSLNRSGSLSSVNSRNHEIDSGLPPLDESPQNSPRRRNISMEKKRKFCIPGRSTSHSRNSLFSRSRKNSIDSKMTPRHRSRKNSFECKTPRHKSLKSPRHKRLSKTNKKKYNVFVSPKTFVQQLNCDENNPENIQLSQKLADFVVLSESYQILLKDHHLKKIKNEEFKKKCVHLQKGLAEKSCEIEEIKRDITSARNNQSERKILIINKEHTFTLKHQNYKQRKTAHDDQMSLTELSNKKRIIGENEETLNARRFKIGADAATLNQKIQAYNNQAQLLNQRNQELARSRAAIVKTEKKLKEETEKFEAMVNAFEEATAIAEKNNASDKLEAAAAAKKKENNAIDKEESKETSKEETMIG